MRTRLLPLLPLLSLAVLVTGVPAAAPTAAEGASGRPTVASISPRIGSTQARQHVTIRGSGFSHVRTVRFGHRRAARVVVLNGRTMVAYAPAQSHGVRDVTVRTSAGTSRRVGADRYDYVRGADPMTRLVPRVAPQAGPGKLPDVEDLSGWSCGSPTTCVAVGGQPAASPTPGAVALTRAAGRTTIARVAGAADLYGVSCAGAGFCGATGIGVGGQPVLATLVGGRWTVRRLPLLDGSGSLTSRGRVGGISCAAVGHCVLDASESSRTVGDLFTLSGTTLTVQALRQPANGSAHPNVELGVPSCATVTWCAVLANYADAGDAGHEMAVIVSHGQERVSEIFGPHHITDPDISGFQCVAVSRCYADGVYFHKFGPFHATFIVLDAHGWHAVAVPDPADRSGDGGFLSDISCPAVGNCVGVGDYDNRGGRAAGQQGVIVRLHGSTVTEQNAPVPTSGSLHDEQLFGVTCRSTTSCVAVGRIGDGALSETLVRSGVWVPEHLGRQPEATPRNEAVLGAVTCPAYATCLASGYADYDYDYDEGEAQKYVSLYALSRPR